ncbi:unnamed protein product [Closterium sp. Naga37s-1]|nr:unnamed protein product [Closterium sp. Naga37s-1]
MAHSTTTSTLPNSSASITAADGATSESLAAALFALDDLPSPLASLHTTLPPPPAAPGSQRSLPEEHRGRFGWSPVGPRGFPEEGFVLHAEPRAEPLNEPLAEPQMTVVGGTEPAGEAAAPAGLGLLTGLTGPAEAAAAVMQGAGGEMGAGSEDERRQLLALLLALKQVEEQQEQQAQQQTQQKARQNARKRQRRQRVMGGQGVSGNPQSPQVQQQEQQQPEQPEQEGRNEEHRFSAGSPFLAGASPELHGIGVMGRMDGRGGERSGSGGSSGGGSGIASGIGNGVRNDPDFSLRGVGNDVDFSLRGVDKNLTSALSNEIRFNAMRAHGINSGVFSGAAANVAGANVGDGGRKRRSPEALDDGATAALQWQHGMQTPAACYSRSVLGHMNQSGVLDGMLLKDADAAAVGAAAVGAAPAHPTLSPLHSSMAEAAGQHMHLLFQQQRLQQQQQQQQQQRCEQASQPLSPEARNQRSRGSTGSVGTGTGGEGSARSGSAGTGMGGAGSAGGPATSSSGQVGGEDGTEGMRGMQGMEEMEGTGQWQSDEDLGEAAPAQQPEWGSDALDNPKGRERGTMQDECGTDDEWLPRCQGVRTGSVPNKRIKSRSMAERRRRERISEGLQRLRAKVRGRGDTCAMLDRAVGYVDALERRVVELERVVMAAAGSGRNVFPGNAFAGGFAGRGFAGNVFANNAAVLTTIPAAMTSVPTGLGGDAVAGWPWE